MRAGNAHGGDDVVLSPRKGNHLRRNPVVGGIRAVLGQPSECQLETSPPNALFQFADHGLKFMVSLRLQSAALGGNDLGAQRLAPQLHGALHPFLRQAPGRLVAGSSAAFSLLEHLTALARNLAETASKIWPFPAGTPSNGRPWRTLH